MAGELAQFSSAALAVDPEKADVNLDALMNYDVITRLENHPIVDDDLLAVLEQE
jgi:hypothetical protein